MLDAFITSNGDGVYALNGNEILMDDAIANNIIVERQFNEN